MAEQAAVAAPAHDIQTKKKIKEKKKLRNKAKSYKRFCIIFVSLMLFFCSSKLWMPDTSKTYSSAYGMQQECSDNIVLTLNKWEYNPNTHYLEAVFGIKPEDENFVYDQDLRFTPKLYQFDAKGAVMNQLTCKTAYADDSTLVIQMPSVPDDWNVLGLSISDNSAALLSIQNAEDPAEQKSKSLFGILDSSDTHAVFYCDSRTVNLNTTLKAGTSKDYAVDAIESEITAIQDKITVCNTQIKRNNEAVTSLQRAIDTLKKKQPYLTDSDLEDVQSQMDAKTSQIKSMQDNNTSITKQIDAYQAKLSKLNVKLGDAYNGVTRTYEDTKPTSSDSSSSSQNVPSSSQTDSSAPSSGTSSVPTSSTSGTSSGPIIYFDVPKSGT
ncbi:MULTISPECIES: hypothetical protein [Caproicibacterium]|uniref:Uncharacterized protein n=1 Tax=Caproicibacterium argilliputei TaxID=3030016 RepID=A0AA97DBF8_9FIRM|nr:hypothetical protein [Caproicibacterium argilliputei]WOC32361.1 hypothetical protein PXC00_00405 [Caproicibacterium argilliputei]